LLTRISLHGAAELGGAVDAGQLLDFVDSGRDLLLAVDSRASDEMRRARCQAVYFAL